MRLEREADDFEKMAVCEWKKDVGCHALIILFILFQSRADVPERYKRERGFFVVFTVGYIYFRLLPDSINGDVGGRARLELVEDAESQASVALEEAGEKAWT